MGAKNLCQWAPPSAAARMLRRRWWRCRDGCRGSGKRGENKWNEPGGQEVKENNQNGRISW